MRGTYLGLAGNEVSRRTMITALLAAGATFSAAPTYARDRQDAELDALLNEFLQENIQASPENASRLGLDVGPMYPLKLSLDDRSLAAAAAQKHRIHKQLARIKAINTDKLSHPASIDHKAVSFTLSLQDSIGQNFAYGSAVTPEPYVVSHLTGAYTSVPELLDSKHDIRSAADAEAYLERVADFARVLDQEIERIQHDAQLGVTPPDFIQDQALVQLAAIRTSDPKGSILAKTIARKAAQAGLSGGHYAARAARLFSDAVVPALDRQIAALKAFRPKASSEAGVWRLPNGDAYYAAALEYSTTVKLSPGTIHEMGLAITEQLRPQLNKMLAAQGYNKGGLAERIESLYTDPRRAQPNTSAGKAKILSELHAKLDRIHQKLPRYFNNLPRTQVVIKAVPEFRQSGAPFAFYEDPSLDGSRPGVFYVNLRDTAETPMWMLTTTAFHEASPGHHLQQALLQEGPPLPNLRKVMFSSGYSEGWALYAEQLADELGMYDEDPIGRIGYMWATLLRASRLVADTGIHAQRWSRAKAIEWMVTYGGVPRSMAVNEVERYCVWPGQACSYMVGKSTWLESRDRAKSALGTLFDIREFHAATIAVGSVPLAVLNDVVDKYIAEARGGRRKAI
tara:strand:- start:23236 stop:25107 length:1872 start_codon:yes stop_codon:yes gene_type:complete